MIKIAHFGSYNVNVGDNIALLNVRRGIEKVVSQKISWKSVDISSFHNCPAGMNNIQYSKRFFETISEESDMLVFGGGGLIESTSRKNNATKWKLPINKEILSAIKIPIVCFALGINYFRNYPQLDETGKKRVRRFKDYSSLFSLRNDGSLGIFQSFSEDKCQEIPDPGLISFKDPSPNRPHQALGFFQPAWNNNKKQMLGRGLDDKNLQKLISLCENHSLKIMPHTLKDYNFPYDNFIYDKQLFRSLVKFDAFEKVVQDYSNYDFSVSMRGHGQMISIAQRVPSVYFSTQDKVRDFSIRNGFSEYNVDIEESNWYEKLNEKIERLKSDKDYVLQWYEHRDKFMNKNKKQFDNFCLQIKDIIE